MGVLNFVVEHFHADFSNKGQVERSSIGLFEDNEPAVMMAIQINFRFVKKGIVFVHNRFYLRFGSDRAAF